MVIFSQFDDEVMSSQSFSFTADAHKYEEFIHTMSSASRPSSSTSSYARSDDSSRSRSPVTQWLALLRDQTEVESLSALQAKSVAIDEESFEALSVRNAQVAIRKIRKDSVEIIANINQLIIQLPLTMEDLANFKEDVEVISADIQSLVEHCRRRGCDAPDPAKGMRRMSSDVAVHGLQIAKFVEDFTQKRNVNNAQLEATLRKMKDRLEFVVNATVKKDCQIIMSALRFPWGSICSKWSLLALWQLTQHDQSMCKLFIEGGGVIRRLIKLSCLGCGGGTSSVNPQLKAAALRVLTHLAGDPEAIKQIFANDHEAGCNLITLLSFERNELVLKEAVGLVVQITLPLIDASKKSSSSSLDFLTKVIPIQLLVKSLTGLARVCTSKELFLLITASLANISFMEGESFLENEVSNVLLSAVKQRVSFQQDIPLKDQIITILANISSSHPLEVVTSGGLVFLLSSLELRPTPATSNLPEGNNRVDNNTLAIERIQQKVAAALARLASHRSCASLLIRLNGIKRLVDVCRDPKERNNSDAVLLACLAALRRIASMVGLTPFRQLNAQDLVSLSLRQAFFMYSARSESFV